MMYNQRLPETAEQYISCFRGLAALTEQLLLKIENETPERSDSEKQKLLTRAMHMVETLAVLRGDTSVILHTRPKGLVEFQDEMYRIEDQLRERLLRLGYVYS